MISKQLSNSTIKTRYYYNINGNLIIEKGSNYRLDFLYDENGYLYGFKYNNDEKYYYIRDIYLNILGIVSQQGAVVVKYDYDAYGNIISITGSMSSTIGIINPFRYKGYYYHIEISMYYCKNRFYYPEWKRWLNGDNPANLILDNHQALNLFAYCGNDPINHVDSNGNFAWLAIVAAIVIAAVVVSVVNNINKNMILDEIDASPRIKESYTKEEAINEIQNTLDNVTNGKSTIEINNNFKITNSYLITDEYLRLQICTILSRTIKNKDGDNIEFYTTRTPKSLSAEWRLHNFGTKIFKEGSDKYNRSKDVDLDFDFEKNESEVKIGTKVLQFFGLY